MASGIFYSGANADDGHRIASDYTNANSYVWWGTSGYLGSFLRFLSVAIPQAASITSATLKLKCANTVSAGTGSADFCCADADDQGQVTNGDEAAFDALSLTTAKTNVPAAAYTLGTWYDFDVTSAVQEVIDRGGWSSENALAVVIKDIDTDVAKRMYAFDYSGGANKPELHVEWVADKEASSSDTIGLADSAAGAVLGESIADTAGFAEAVVGMSLTRAVTDGVGLADANAAVNLSRSASDGLGLAETTAREMTWEMKHADPVVGLADVVVAFVPRGEITDGIGCNVATARSRDRYRVISDVLGAVFSLAGLNTTTFENTYLGGDGRARRAVEFYICQLTGGTSGLPTLTLPMLQFQSRLRKLTPTFLEVVIPGLGYSADISARADGELILSKGFYEYTRPAPTPGPVPLGFGVHSGGTGGDVTAGGDHGIWMNRSSVAPVELLREPMVVVDLETITIEQSVGDERIILSGSRTQDFSNKIHDLKRIFSKKVSNGQFTYQAAPDMYIRAGDTILDPDAPLGTIVDRVSISVGVNSESMEVHTGEILWTYIPP